MLEIHGFQKTTLLDYPGCLASTVFFGGCNFRCPYCHNGDLVLSPGSLPLISEDTVLSHLKKRQGIWTVSAFPEANRPCSRNFLILLKKSKI